MTIGTVLTQEEIIGKIYRDFARLAGELSLDRCRNRVLLALVKDKFGVSDDELHALFQQELEANLETFVHDITGPMLREFEEPEAGGCGSGGCCGGH